MLDIIIEFPFHITTSLAIGFAPASPRAAMLTSPASHANAAAAPMPALCSKLCHFISAAAKWILCHRRPKRAKALTPRLTATSVFGAKAWEMASAPLHIASIDAIRGVSSLHFNRREVEGRWQNKALHNNAGRGSLLARFDACVVFAPRRRIYLIYDAIVYHRHIGPRHE